MYEWGFNYEELGLTQNEIVEIDKFSAELYGLLGVAHDSPLQ
jgi:hypothetical protein